MSGSEICPNTVLRELKKKEAALEAVNTALLRTLGSVSKVDMATPMPLIYKTVFPAITTFETLPTHVMSTVGFLPIGVGTSGYPLRCGKVGGALPVG